MWLQRGISHYVVDGESLHWSTAVAPPAAEPRGVKLARTGVRTLEFGKLERGCGYAALIDLACSWAHGWPDSRGREIGIRSIFPLTNHRLQVPEAPTLKFPGKTVARVQLPPSHAPSILTYSCWLSKVSKYRPDAFRPSCHSPILTHPRLRFQKLP